MGRKNDLRCKLGESVLEDGAQLRIWYPLHLVFSYSGVCVFCVSYMKKEKKSREHNSTYERRSPKILSFSFSSCVQHVIHTVSTNSINATTHTGYNISNHLMQKVVCGNVGRGVPLRN